MTADSIETAAEKLLILIFSSPTPLQVESFWGSLCQFFAIFLILKYFFYSFFNNSSETLGSKHKRSNIQLNEAVDVVFKNTSQYEDRQLMDSLNVMINGLLS